MTNCQPKQANKTYKTADFNPQRQSRAGRVVGAILEKFLTDFYRTSLPRHPEFLSWLSLMDSNSGCLSQINPFLFTLLLVTWFYNSHSNPNYECNEGQTMRMPFSISDLTGTSPGERSGTCQPGSASPGLQGIA